MSLLLPTSSPIMYPPPQAQPAHEGICLPSFTSLFSHTFYQGASSVHQIIFPEKLSGRLLIKVLRLILWPLTAHATKDRRACKHFHRLSALRALFQKSPPDELFPHKTCFESWHWNSHHSKLFTDPTKVWSMFELAVMICASKVCWFCPDVAR